MKLPEYTQQTLGDIQERAEEAGISPVVGAILMVAITVVLASVLMVVVTDLAGNASPEPQASVYITDTPEGVELTLYSVSNAESIEVRVGDDVLHQWNLDGTEKRQISLIGVSTDDRVTIVGFADGKERVLDTHTPEFDIEPTLDPQLGSLATLGGPSDSLIVPTKNKTLSIATTDGVVEWETSVSNPNYAVGSESFSLMTASAGDTETPIETKSLSDGSTRAVFTHPEFSQQGTMDNTHNIYLTESNGVDTPSDLVKVETQTGTEKWSYTFPDQPNTISVVENVVIVYYEDPTTSDRYLTGVDTTDGTELWTTPAPGMLSLADETEEGVIYQGVGNVLMVDSTGSTSTLPIDASVKWDGSYIYATDSDTLTVYDDGDGSVQDTYSVNGKIMAVDADGSIYTADGFDLYKYSPDGTEEWSITTSEWLPDSGMWAFK